MTLSEKIHQLRKQKGLSQEELASQLTVSRQAISKWELGESVPDTENVVQISKLFGVSTDYLLLDSHEQSHDAHEQSPDAHAQNTHISITGHRYKTMLCSFLLVSIIALVVSTIVWVQNYQHRGIVSGVCFLLILTTCFYIEIKQAFTKRINFYSIAVWFILPIPVWAVVHQAKFHYPRPFLYGMQYLAFIAIYFISSVTITLVLRLLKK